MEIYNAITSSKVCSLYFEFLIDFNLFRGKATLLLPLEPVLTHEKITAEFVKDHVVQCEGPSRNNAHIVTLSGIRGTLNQCVIFFFSIYVIRTHCYLSSVRY
jgi:hypothetical protein